MARLDRCGRRSSAQLKRVVALVQRHCSSLARSLSLPLPAFEVAVPGDNRTLARPACSGYDFVSMYLIVRIAIVENTGIPSESPCSE